MRFAKDLKKNNAVMSFPEQLSLNQSDAGDESTVNYALMAVAQHSGTMMSGH
jgi:hypothetical protein